jgi:hypothetical protein
MSTFGGAGRGHFLFITLISPDYFLHPAAVAADNHQAAGQDAQVESHGTGHFL